MPDAATKRVLQTIGANVRAARIKNGWTQAEVAEVVGLETRYLQNIEYGSSSPSIKTLVGLAEALGVSLSSFFRARKQARANPGRPRRKASKR